MYIKSSNELFVGSTITSKECTSHLTVTIWHNFKKLSCLTLPESHKQEHATILCFALLVHPDV